MKILMSIKFHGNTTMPVCLYVVCDCFRAVTKQLNSQSCMQHTKPKIFIIWLFTEKKKLLTPCSKIMGFPSGLVVKNPPANVGDSRDTGQMPRSGISLGGENGNPLQYSYLENPMDRGAWWATVCRVPNNLTHDLMTRHSLVCICSKIFWILENNPR